MMTVMTMMIRIEACDENSHRSILCIANAVERYF